MPTREPITNTIIPPTEVKPIPVRVVTTRPRAVTPKVTAPEASAENAGQQVTNNSSGAVETTPKTEETVKLSPQLSALARKEQAFRQREQALKEREESMAAKLADAEKYEQLKSKLSTKDFAEAEALGLDYEAYTQYRLDKLNGEDPQMAKIKELETKIEALTKGNEESAAAQYEETIAEYKTEIVKAVASNPEFSTIKGLKREDAVLQLILDAFEKDGEELSVSEACQQVEEYLVDYGKNFTELPKFKKTESQQPPQKPLPRPNIGATLTNNMNAGSDKRPLKPLHQLSESERYAEARRRALEKREQRK